MYYTDIPLSELSAVRGFIRQKHDVKKNLAGTRCIVKGNTQDFYNYFGVENLKTKSQAEAYYNNHINGWVEEIDLEQP